MPQDCHDILNHQHIDLDCLFNSLFRLTSNKPKFHMDNCWWRNRPAAIGFISQQGKSEGFDSCDQPNKFTQIGVKSSILEPMWSWNLMDHPKDNMAPLLYYIVLCPSFHSHQWIQTEDTVRKPSIRAKIGDFLSRVSLKLDGWTWKTIGHLLDASSSHGWI